MTDPVRFDIPIPKERRVDVLHGVCRHCAAQFFRECSKRAGAPEIGKKIDPELQSPSNRSPAKKSPSNRSPAKKKQRLLGADDVDMEDTGPDISEAELAALFENELVDSDPYDDMAMVVDLFEFGEECLDVIGGARGD